MKHNDIVTIQRAQKGDALALARLHDRYYHTLYRYFYYRLSDPARATQLTSDLFVRMVKRISLFKPDHAPFLPWLYNLAKSILMEDRLHQAEKLQHVQEKPGSDTASPPATPMGQPTSPAERFHRALGRLSADEREILVGRLIEKRPLRQVAREIGRTAAAARALQASALQKFHLILKEEERA